MTEAEEILWERIRAKSFGIKFRRQMPFVFGEYKYVVDFYCASKKLIIEIDGSIHHKKEVKENDIFREDLFKVNGYTVLRFNNHDVINNIDIVLEKIKSIVINY